MQNKLQVLSHAPMKDSQMDAISNIQFDNREAEQMQDPEFRAEVEKLEFACQVDCGEIVEQWEALHQSILDLGRAVTEVLTPMFQQVMDAVYLFAIQLRRVQLYISLTQRWRIPERPARWLSDKWPERWLPELRFE